MKITVLQPNLFPLESYFDIVKKVDKVIFADDTFYNKKSWVNKTILKKHEQRFIFRVAVDTNEEDKRISDLTVSVSNWRKNFLKAVASQYKQSVNFGKVFPVIKEVIKLPSENISHIAAYSIFRISDLLNMKTEFSLASVNYKNLEGSFYKKIISICKQERANEFYTFGMYRRMFETDFFLRNKIKVSFFSSPERESFSIIDKLMNDETLFKK
jgi:hypothetical protein